MLIANSADGHARGSDLAAFDAQLSAMVDVCLERKVDLFTHAGDAFDRDQIGCQQASTGAVAAVWIKHLKRLTDAGI